MASRFVRTAGWWWKVMGELGRSEVSGGWSGGSRLIGSVGPWLGEICCFLLVSQIVVAWSGPSYLRLSVPWTGATYAIESTTCNRKIRAWR
jgi:hypothetical protein